MERDEKNSVQSIDEKLDDVCALANRFYAFNYKKVNGYFANGVPENTDSVEENMFLTSAFLIMSDIKDMKGSNISNDAKLSCILDLCRDAFTLLCWLAHGGSICAFCDIKDCNLNACKTPEEKEAMRKKFEQMLEEEEKK